MEIKYYLTASGRNPVLDFIQELSPQTQDQFYDLILKLEEGETLALPESRPLVNVHRHLHELRVKDVKGIYRIFYYLKVKDAIYMVHAFKKKTQKTPIREIKLAVKRLKEI